MLDPGGGGGAGIPGDPGAIRAQAGQLAAASRHAVPALSQIANGRDTALGGWQGNAADAFERHATTLRSAVDKFIDLGSHAAGPLYTYADALAAAQAAYAAAAATAVEEHDKAAAAEDDSQEKYEAAKAAYDAERAMQGAQIAAWEANYRAAQQIAALIGWQLPCYANPYAYEPPPPPEPPEQDHGLLSTIGHTVLDVAGLIPVVGEPADAINAVWYTAEGDYTNAALSAAGMIPFAGWAATGGKFAIKGTDAVRAARTAGGITSAGRAAPPGTALPGPLVPSAPPSRQFVTTPRGTTFDVPGGWTSRTADNGKGIVFQRPGAVANADTIRIMEPTPRYPDGYFVYTNQLGQPLNVHGKPGPRHETHIPEGYLGKIEGWPR